MICAHCFGTVLWHGPLSNLTHTQCRDCGRINCQQVNEAAEVSDHDENNSEES